MIQLLKRFFSEIEVYKHYEQHETSVVVTENLLVPKFDVLMMDKYNEAFYLSNAFHQKCNLTQK